MIVRVRDVVTVTVTVTVRISVIVRVRVGLQVGFRSNLSSDQGLGQGEQVFTSYDFTIHRIC